MDYTAHQIPLSKGFTKQEYWAGLPFPPPGDLPDPWIEPTLLCLLHWPVGSLALAPPGKPNKKGEIWTRDIYTGRMPSEGEGRDWRAAPMSRRMPKIARSLGRSRERILPGSPRKEPILRTPCSWTSGLWDYTSLWFKPPGLWCFVTVAPGN